MHGQPGSARDWQRVLCHLGERAHAIAIDRPGWDSRTAAGGFELNGRAALAALDAAEAQRVTVVGHSFGGGVAAWLAAHHPDRVARLLLAAPAANVAALSALDRALALPGVGPVLSRATLLATGLALSAAPLRRQIARRATIDPRYLSALGRTLLEPPVWRAFVTEQRAMLRDLPLLERELNQIRAPTVIVAGTLDRVVPPAATRALAAQIPGARLLLLGRAGHLLPHLHAERLSELIVEGSDQAVARAHC